MPVTARHSAAHPTEPVWPVYPTPPTSLTPLSDKEFATRMARFAPFERAPAIAVAVSGGRDSMSLALLASRWAVGQGGDMVAVTVDHGLRPDSASEAQLVGEWLADRGIRHHVLRWQGPYPASGIQAAARAARYRLLSDFCRDQAILHLLVAHHREDQAETMLIRRERASGGDGLAAMAAVGEQAHMRLLRPLLDVPRERLTASLAAAGQAWIDDPSNDDTDMARGRLRARTDRLPFADILAVVEENGGNRVSAERAVARVAARVLRLHPGGFATVDRAVLASEAPEIVERLLARTVMAVAGRGYPPRSARTRRLCEAMVDAGPFSSRTLGGCRLIGDGDLVHICREAANVGRPVCLTAGASTIWDNRFSVSLTKNLERDCCLGALTASGWDQIVAIDSELRNSPVPHAARIVLPAVWHGEQVAAVPHIGIVNHRKDTITAGLRLRWRPAQAVAPAPFGKV